MKKQQYSDNQVDFSTDFIYKLKIVILGHKNVGKSTLLYSYTNGCSVNYKIQSQYTDILFKNEYYESNSKRYQCKLHLWDTTGFEDSQFIQNIMMKDVRGIILVMDRNNRQSFEVIKQKIWKSIDRNKMPHVEIFLLLNDKLKNKKQNNNNNKIQRQILSQSLQNRIIIPQFETQLILKQQIIKFTNEINIIKLYQFSVQNYNDVNKMFQDMINLIMLKVQQNIINVKDIIITDRKNKIILKTNQYNHNFYCEKRYNRCC